MVSKKNLAEFKFLQCPVTANFRIICTDPQFVNVHWDFYLKGILDASQVVDDYRNSVKLKM